MRRSDRRKVREGCGLRRSVRDNKLVRAELRAGRCPCEHHEIDNPGEHLPSCPWSDPDYEGYEVF